MAVSAAMSAVGLAALIVLPGPSPLEDEGPVAGAGSLHVTVEERSEERLRVGDRVEYTIKVRHSGDEAMPQARIVQFLPDSMRYVSNAPDDVEAGAATWEQPLEAGERVVRTVTAELTAVPEGSAQPVSAVCVRPSAEAELAACTSSVHQVRKQAPVVWVVAGISLVVFAAVAAGGYLRYRGIRGASPEPECDHAPESGPELPAVQEETPLCHLDAQR